MSCTVSGALGILINFLFRKLLLLKEKELKKHLEVGIFTSMRSPLGPAPPTRNNFPGNPKHDFPPSAQGIDYDVVEGEVENNDREGMETEEWDFDYDEDTFDFEEDKLYEVSEPSTQTFSNRVCQVPKPNRPESVPNSRTEVSCLPVSTSSSSCGKGAFKPPFRQSDLTRSNSGKSSTFKSPGDGKAPQDNASEFRGQYQHTREMYKIFNQVILSNL